MCLWFQRSHGNLWYQALLESDGSQNEDYSVRSIPGFLLPSEQLDNIDVIILADVEITEEQVGRLSHFVRKGNGLVWFGGDNVKTTLWNSAYQSRPTPLLPGTLGERIDIGNASAVGDPLNHEMPLHGVCLPLRSLPDDLLARLFS